MDMPDVTLVQKLVAAAAAASTAVMTVLAVFGVVSTTQGGAITGAILALGGVYVAADAVIRNGRSRALTNPETVRELERPGPAAFND
jgi:drug/metabolite transporter superfamily protein YnfA